MLPSMFSINSFVIILFINFNQLLSVPDIIRVGGLFESGDDSLEMAFKHAIDRVNSDQKVLPRTKLIPQIDRIEQGDSFQASKKACGLFRKGIVALFGPQSIQSSTHIQSTCDVLHIPHMKLQLDYHLIATNFTLNLFPPPKAFGVAIRDLIKNKKWKKFAIVYKENEALLRLEEVLKDEELRKRKIIVRQFDSDEFRVVFKELHKHQVKNLVVDVPQDNIYDVLKHAKSVSMLSEYHDYVFTTLDLQNIDLDDFVEVGTNISAFSLIDRFSDDYSNLMREFQGAPVSAHQIFLNEAHVIPEERILQNLTTEAALMYDAVKLLAHALHLLNQDVGANIAHLSCDGGESWYYGSNLMQLMKTVRVPGMTGELKFDKNNLRNHVKLDIYQLEHEGVKLVGNWTVERNITFMSNYSEAMADWARTTLENKTLTITTFKTAPYSMIIDTPECKDKNYSQITNDCLEGFAVDMVRHLSEQLKFKYEFWLVADKAYGQPNEQGEWTGMIRELIDGKRDLAVADLTITHLREQAVDFTQPFMNLGIGILFKKQKKEAPSLFSFMAPLAVEVWVYLLTAFLAITLFQFIVARFSPYEWMNPHPCIRNPDELENSFTIKNTLWFTIGCLMQQGCYVMPKSLSTRVLAASWWFFILILVSSYTANLAAFLTTERMANPIESVEDLAKQTKIHYGCLKSGSTKKFFQNSTFSTYARMWSFMESARPSVFVDTNEKGVERVKKGHYAYLMETTSIDYTVERECDLYQVGQPLDSKGYGIATQPGSPWRKPISEEITKMQEGGDLLKLKDKWWSQKKCPKENAQKASGTASELGLANVGGVFVVLALGSLISVGMAVGEFFWKMKQIPREERDHLFIELMRELKNVTCCYGRARPVRRITLDITGQAIMPSDDGGYPPMPILRYSYPHPLHQLPVGEYGAPMNRDDTYLWRRRPAN